MAEQNNTEIENYMAETRSLFEAIRILKPERRTN